MPFSGAPISRDAVLQAARRGAPRAVARFGGTTPEVAARVATAIAQLESRRYPLAWNGYGGDDRAIGLMQMKEAAMRDVERWLGLPRRAHDTLYNPDPAMLYGTTYVLWQRSRYGTWWKAIYSYHAGSYPGSAKYVSRSQDYARRVLDYYRQFFNATPEEDERQGTAEESILPTLLTLGVLGVGGYVLYRALA